MATLEELHQIGKIDEGMKVRALGNFEDEAFKFGKLMIDDDGRYPEEMKKDFWMVFDKELALTNLDPKQGDIKWFMFMYDIARLDWKMSKAPFELTFENLRNLDMLEMKLRAKLMRSTGGMQRERGLFAQQHQIRQFITNESDKPKGGFLSKVAGAFGGK